MPHLSRVLRLPAVAALVALLVAVAPSTASAGATAREGIDSKALATICAALQGEFRQDPKSPYPYGCELPEGSIRCEKSARCGYFRLDDLPPLQESCGRVGGKYHQLLLDYTCWVRDLEIQVICDVDGDCGVGHEQPMPHENPVRTRA
ncbi:hypothetical protein F4553_006972 [Allocatelliglobosispora scoriae]|uniref:Secreted protein n=1 Tax=Allocatelliglobosispora scoriae TaxID=643052 RepID=A0A841C1B7_9ACTN|nr:hypothetical protein [Allocatelliglobosispora scoriae]MBB5873538.1 hypothetical protein [Allocatelliglobosispora scoriae]